MDKFTKVIKINLSLLLLILMGSLSWSITMIKSGLTYDYGMGFWGPNGHDGVWHLAVIESLNRGSWNNPVFSGSLLQNYHIGYDLLVSILHKITFIPVVTLYFQVLPVVFSILIGLSCYRFVFVWKKSRTAAWWSCFFVYFGGSWGWIITLLRSRELGGESMFWSQQSISTLINPPFALSLILLFVGLELLVRIKIPNNSLLEIAISILNLIRNKFYKKVTTKSLLVVISFVFGVTLFIKVYAGLLILGALFVAGTYQLIIKKQGIRLLQIFISSLSIALLFFLSVYSEGASLVWKPFWFIETMMQLSDRLDWHVFGDAMVNYRLGNVWWKAIPAYGLAFLIFWYGNVGTRLLSEYYVAKKIVTRSIDYIDLILFSMIAAGVLIPTFFVQTGTPWNTIQFMYYSLLFSGVLAGIAVSEIMKTKLFKSIVIQSVVGFVVVILTIPTTISTLKNNYIPSRPPSMITHDELRALRFLSRQPEGVVLTFPFDSVLAAAAVSNPPRPLYLYESTAYVSAFSKHDVFLEDEVNLNITGYKWPDRRSEVETFLNTTDSEIARNFLASNNIKYIYWLKGQRATLGEEQLGIEKMFENENVDIYKVND